VRVDMGGGALVREGAARGRHAAVLREGKVEPVVIPLAGEEDEGVRQDRDQQEIEDAEEDEARRDADPVAAVRETERDRVEKPDKVGPAGQSNVVARVADAAGAAVALRQSAEQEGEVGRLADGEEPPLVVASGVSREEVRENPETGKGWLALLPPKGSRR